jgi:hypothetical protein
MFALFRNRPKRSAPADPLNWNLPSHPRWVAQLSVGLRLRFGFFAAGYSKKYLASTRANEIIEP